ncbi:MAG TPA: alpha/beta fold hydrolase [Xanthobacteraceae bacterium]|nr:alpha/beta fold hydrolase [Xanthobacteraceae bacterium]
MPHASASDGVRLYYEEVGSGTPILFIHEFAADHKSWEPQMRFFARSHRCIAYSARGYRPSDVPKDADAYTYKHFRDDVIAVLDHLGIEKAHIVGLSMGGYSAVQVGLEYPQRALSLTLAGTGSGSARGETEEFRRTARAIAEQFETEGSAAVAQAYGVGPGRVPFLVKDPRGFQEFREALAAHDAQGSANTMRKFQGERPPLHAFDAAIRRLALPVLIIVGDEDDPCIEPSLYLKQAIPASGLAVFPKSGHTVNLEEPALFNRTLADFLARVEAGRWAPRDPRSVRAK